MIATEALQEIARHEKECGLRWAEAHAELKQLHDSVRAHSARWEKLAWLVIFSVIGGVLATVVKSWL
tara:strand:- start:1319 stop:1519 length:201 start_codon:yes stop_codon:yes gene_type:complete